MVDTPLVPLDEAAYDRFCGGLIEAGFSPVEGTERRRWDGPIRESLTPFTTAARMEIGFRDGWPLRYPYIRVVGLGTDHSSGGYVCLWADDDPAQHRARDIAVLWSRIDEWALAAEDGFRVEDQSLDGYFAFTERNYRSAEVPIGDLIAGNSNGTIVPVGARTQGVALIINPASGEKPLRGAVYVRNSIGQAPTDLAGLMNVLTRRQKRDLERGLADRDDVKLHESSGGHDFIVLAWPRHDGQYEVLVLSFAGAGPTLKASACTPTPSDSGARARRAGPDFELLNTKRILVAGAGSVGGHVAMSLACSGVREIRLCDDDILKYANLVRHVTSHHFVGYDKSRATAVEIEGHAPWCNVIPGEALSLRPDSMAVAVAGQDLVIDCTGNFAVTALLIDTCYELGVPLLTGSLYHQGSLARTRRQGAGDTPIASRTGALGYLQLPPAPATAGTDGFLEVGCIARIHNAPPSVVLATASHMSLAAIDLLTGRNHLPDEVIEVFAPMAEPPFDKIGMLIPEAVDGQ